MAQPPPTVPMLMTDPGSGVRMPTDDGLPARGVLCCIFWVFEGVRAAQGCTALKKKERSSYLGDGGRNSSSSCSAAASA